MAQRIHSFDFPKQGFTTSHMTTGGSGQHSRAGDKIGKFDDTGFHCSTSTDAKECSRQAEEVSIIELDLLGRPLKNNKASGPYQRGNKATALDEVEKSDKGLRAMLRKLCCQR